MLLIQAFCNIGCVQVQEVAQAAKLERSDSADSGVIDRSMQRTSTAFKNRSGFRGVRRVCDGMLAFTQ